MADICQRNIGIFLLVRRFSVLCPYPKGFPGGSWGKITKTLGCIGALPVFPGQKPVFSREFFCFSLSFPYIPTGHFPQTPTFRGFLPGHFRCFSQRTTEAASLCIVYTNTIHSVPASPLFSPSPAGIQRGRRPPPRASLYVIYNTILTTGRESIILYLVELRKTLLILL